MLYIATSVIIYSNTSSQQGSSEKKKKTRQRRDAALGAETRIRGKKLEGGRVRDVWDI